MFIKERKLHKKLNNINKNKTIPLSANHAKSFNNLLELRKQGWRYADKHCRKLNMGNVPFSPTVASAGRKIQLWKAIITKKKAANTA